EMPIVCYSIGCCLSDNSPVGKRRGLTSLSRKGLLVRARLIKDRVSEAAGLFLARKAIHYFMRLNWETNSAYTEGGHDRDLHSDMITFFYFPAL
ncbi:MAG: hypothetical protein J1E82_06825, partial [Muribaculaceae bacterium]|nr:hypothetical protein [Muribaculaceae bacterium]